MPVKRSRIGRSSSFGNSEVFNQLLPSPIVSPELRYDCRETSSASVCAKRPSNATKALNLSAVATVTVRSLPVILTLASPEIEESREGNIGIFFEKCYHCKKTISEKDEVFMYGYLRAFCSFECRDKHIAIDKKAGGKVASEQSTETKTKSGEIKAVKLFGVQL